MPPGPSDRPMRTRNHAGLLPRYDKWSPAPIWVSTSPNQEDWNRRLLVIDAVSRMLHMVKEDRPTNPAKDGIDDISSSMSDIEVVAINDPVQGGRGGNHPFSVSIRMPGQDSVLHVRGPTREETIDLLILLREGSSKPVLLNLEDHYLKGYKRNEVRKAHPRYSLQRLELYVEWLNSLHVWETRIKVSTLTREMASGLLLCAIMERLVPGTTYQGLHKRPLSRLAAIHNVEQGLAVVWRAARVNNSLIPTAAEIYQGTATRINALIAEIFEVYVLRPIRSKFEDMVRWYNSVLKHYERDLPKVCDLADLWTQFQDGVSLFCVLYHFYGTSLVGMGENSRQVDARKLHARPLDLAQHRSNVQECFILLQAIGIDVVWGVDIWLSYPDADFVLYQLFKVYDHLVEKVCVLPPAQADKPGLVSGPYGLRVTGLLFADGTLEQKAERPEDSPRQVYLGDGSKQTLALLPVCDSQSPLPHFGKGMTLSTPADHVQKVECSGESNRDNFLRRQSVEQKERGWNASIANSTAYRNEDCNSLLALQVST